MAQADGWNPNQLKKLIELLLKLKRFNNWLPTFKIGRYKKVDSKLSLLTKESSELIFSKNTKQKETMRIYFVAPNNPPNSLFKNPKKRILATFVNAFPAMEILTRIMIKVKAKEKIFIYDSSIDSN